MDPLEIDDKFLPTTFEPQLVSMRGLLNKALSADIVYGNTRAAVNHLIELHNLLHETLREIGALKKEHVVSNDVEIALNGKNYMLEAGDRIIVEQPRPSQPLEADDVFMDPPGIMDACEGKLREAIEAYDVREFAYVSEKLNEIINDLTIVLGEI